MTSPRRKPYREAETSQGIAIVVVGLPEEADEACARHIALHPGDAGKKLVVFITGVPRAKEPLRAE